MSGEAKFQEHFHKIYGSRWADLYPSLLVPEKQMIRMSRWGSGPRDFFDYKLVDPMSPVVPSRQENDLLDLYVMDPGSYWAALALNVQEGDHVLDMCAAPGGKSLILLEALERGGELIANEISAGRRERLVKVIQQYVPREVRNRVWVKGQDGAQYGLHSKGKFDKILLDAPCSGERHLLQTPAELAQFTSRRTEHLASRQYALLAAAWLAVRPGGDILYSTCSISPEENDDVVKKLQKKKKDIVFKAPWFASDPRMEKLGLEKTEFGYQFLPDRSGCGPLYFSLFSRLLED